MNASRPLSTTIDPHELTCQELAAIVTEFLEESLSEPERLRFEAHLDVCEGCRRHLDQMRLTINALGRLRESDIPDEAKQRLLTAFRTWKRSED